jgi:heat shock protein HslJ
MKYVLLCSALALLAACGGKEPVGTTSNSSSSSSSSTSSSSSSNSGSSSSSSTSSSGGSGDGELVPGALTNAVWELRYVENELGIRRASNIPMTLRFDEDRKLEGTTTCGAFSASYWVRHGAMGFDQAPEVPLDCAPRPWSLLEQDYYAALNNVVRFVATESELKLFTSNNATAVYEPAGIKCETPKIVGGEATSNASPPWTPETVLLKTDDLSDEFIQRLREDYPDLEFRSMDACGPGQIAVSVNRITLQYLRCRSDITAITYQ